MQSRIAGRDDRCANRLERVLGVLGTFMPLAKKTRKKIAVGLQRAGFRSSNAVTS